jgi:hypothetical protein
MLSEEVPLACGLTVDEGQAVFGRRFAEWIEAGVIRAVVL